VTNGAAITEAGDIATWTPGSTAYRWNRCGNQRTVAISQFWDSDWRLAIYEDGSGHNSIDVLPDHHISPGRLYG
jgi:hypothetical protein